MVSAPQRSITNRPGPAVASPKIGVRDLDFYYGVRQALFGVSLDIAEKHITALIGPSGCGKTSFLRTLNRMYETIPHTRAEGRVSLDGEDVLSMEVAALRRRVGMVFQKSNPFPKTIYENVAYGLRVNGWDQGRTLNELVENSLRRAALFEEVKEDRKSTRLNSSHIQKSRMPSSA